MLWWLQPSWLGETLLCVLSIQSTWDMRQVLCRKKIHPQSCSPWKGQVRYVAVIVVRLGVVSWQSSTALGKKMPFPLGLEFPSSTGSALNGVAFSNCKIRFYVFCVIMCLPPFCCISGKLAESFSSLAPSAASRSLGSDLTQNNILPLKINLRDFLLLLFFFMPILPTVIGMYHMGCILHFEEVKRQVFSLSFFAFADLSGLYHYLDTLFFLWFHVSLYQHKAVITSFKLCCCTQTC